MSQTKPPSDKKSKGERCRICGAPLSESTSAVGPFCSARCRMQDLSKWFGENYRIASSQQQIPDGDDESENQ